jgi:hypothetical protein
MKSTSFGLLLLVLALSLGACATASKTLFVPSQWDDEFVTLWASKAEERGLTVGTLVNAGKTVQTESDLLEAVKKAQKEVFGGNVNDLRIDQFRKIGRSYVVCIGDGRGVCYFLTMLGEAGVIYHPIGTIGR